MNYRILFLIDYCKQIQLFQVNIYKQPITDPGKNSKRGLLTLEYDEDGKYVTRTENSGDPKKVLHATRYKTCDNILKLIQDLLETVFNNGKLIKEYTLDEVRKRAELPLIRKK